MSVKICPLKFAGPQWQSYKCEREECAWYNESRQQCAITIIVSLMAGGIEASLIKGKEGK